MDAQTKQRIAAQAKIFKALGHPSRLLMVDALRKGELCVCDLQELVGADMSTISRHLSVLREAGVVSSDRRGTSIYYRLAMPCVDTFMGCTGDVARRQISPRLQIW